MFEINSQRRWYPPSFFLSLSLSFILFFVFLLFTRDSVDTPIWRLTGGGGSLRIVLNRRQNSLRHP